MSLVIVLKWIEYNCAKTASGFDYAGGLNNEILKINKEEERKKLVQSEKTLQYNTGDSYSLAFKSLHKDSAE
jgi:hypothetical protein